MLIRLCGISCEKFLVGQIIIVRIAEMFKCCGIIVLLGLTSFSAALDLGWPEHCIDCDPAES